jgi:hypothetical protein
MATWVWLVYGDYLASAMVASLEGLVLPVKYLGSALAISPGSPASALTALMEHQCRNRDNDGASMSLIETESGPGKQRT